MKNSVVNLLGVKKNEPLAPYTTFKVGGPARYFLIAETSDAIVQALEAALDDGIPYYLLGAGSNVLVSDQGFPGLVIKTANKKIQIDDTSVTVEAGFPLSRFLVELAKNELSGLEYMVGIPAQLGGAVAGNAGTMKEFIGEKITSAQVFDTNTRRMMKIPNQDCAFGYRISRFKHNEKEVILSATFELSKSSKKEILDTMSSYIKKRNKQPTGDACAGCIFKNPPGMSSGKLIQEIGLKGKTIGRAQVSEDHANFIVNLGGATAEQIVMLISFIKQQVRDAKGIQLQEEIRYVGF